MEVKRTEKSTVGGGRTWPGSSFIRTTLRDLTKLTQRHRDMVTPRPTVLPTMWLRGSFEEWRVFVPLRLMEDAILPKLQAGPLAPAMIEWVEIGPNFFFELDERLVEPGRLDKA